MSINPISVWLVTGFSPTQISGCLLWLDARDSSSITGTSPVTSWRDKSGNGNNATAAGTPTLTPNGINGRQSITTSTAAASYFTGAISLSGPSLTCFAVALTTASQPRGGQDQRLVSLANTTNVDYGRTDGTIALFNQGSTSTIATWRTPGLIANNTVVQNSPFLAVSQYDGTNGYLWFNGSAGTLASSASGGSFGITKYGISNQANPTVEYWNGFIGEVIIYNSAITTAQRQQVEGYLAWKWGLEASLPASHPYKNISVQQFPPSGIFPQVPLPTSITLVPTLVPYTNKVISYVFNPRQISGCQLWFDAADRTTFTLNGSAVSSWGDKSGNGYSVGQATVANQPTYAGNLLNRLPGVQLSASTYLYQLGSNMPNFSSSSSTTVFIVAKNGSSLGGGWNIVNTMYFTGGSGATLRYHFSFGQSGTNGVTLYVSNTQIGQTTAVPLNTNAIIGFTASAAGENIDVNGTITNYAGVAPISAADSTWFIFGDARGTLVADVNIYEFVGFSSTLTTIQRQQVEGYLGWKWGLQGSLPANHPYKLFPPPQ